MLKLVSTDKEIKKINKEYGYYIEDNKDIITVRYADGTALIEIVYIEKDDNVIILNREEVLWPDPPFTGVGFTEYKGIKINASKPYPGHKSINVNITV